ncbi:hypothetical protein HOLleu_39166 [Holothuria leucospilota]|uniref:Uncharacterized protein n=1 Tax=Holothuria leucospilota TaxID=206669 RepID=A0A9Q0YFT3_HOLLE|nr:hypothetical protein HOLleu_39166 [Holothuria leucospilota]
MSRPPRFNGTRNWNYPRRRVICAGRRCRPFNSWSRGNDFLSYSSTCFSAIW